MNTSEYQSSHHPACTYPDTCDCNGAFAGVEYVKGYYAPCVTRGHVDCEVYLTMKPVLEVNHIRSRSSGSVEGMPTWEQHIGGTAFHYLPENQTCSCDAQHTRASTLSNTNGRCAT